jgi:hypothetical protein
MMLHQFSTLLLNMHLLSMFILSMLLLSTLIHGLLKKSVTYPSDKSVLGSQE